jgi:transposase InsO family protein
MMALLNRPLTYKLIFHSDRSIQNDCGELKELIRNPLVIQTMSRKGNCLDNVVAESIFKTK